MRRRSQPDTAAGGDGRPQLRLEDVRVHYGAVRAVDGVTLWVDPGETLGLIGPNGAGKTTLMNVMSGFRRPTAGEIFVGDREVTTGGPRRMVGLGVGRTFQGGRLFPGLTVLENVELGALGTGVAPKRAKLRAWELLETMGLTAKHAIDAGSLPYGDQRRLGIIRALATEPQFLLLDEPAAGLNEAETDDLLRVISEIRTTHGCAVVLIEHDMRLIMGLCDRIHVLDHGETLDVGTPDAVRRNPEVIAAYLGQGAGDAAA
jgi:branched-chain amino acid transport system ATP-binding protein